MFTTWSGMSARNEEMDIRRTRERKRWDLACWSAGDELRLWKPKVSEARDVKFADPSCYSFEILISSQHIGSETQMTIVKIQRAVEDILDKLDMPSLDLFKQPIIAQPNSSPLETRGNSEEPSRFTTKGYTQRNVSPDPMNSLMEATKLNGLRSQLRTAKLRRKGGMRRMESDLISDGIISHEQANMMLAKFQQTQARHLYSATLKPDATVESIRSSSTVLFEAIILVASLHTPGKEQIHEICQGRVMALASAIMFDRWHTLDDILGLCIAAMWQPDLSWKISGLGMRIATELNLQHALYEAFSVPISDGQSRIGQQEALEKARLWYMLYLLDHQSGVAYGRPPMKSALRPIKDLDILLNSELCTPSDRALLAQVTGFTILSRAFDHFGLEPNRAMDGSDDAVLHHMMYTEELRSWKDQWTMVDEFDLSRSIMLQFHFSSLVLHSLVLRGRPLDKIADLPACLRPLALKAINAAHSILQHFLHESTYRDEIIGMPFYLHSMIAFAVVFILKLSRRWHAIGINMDPQTVSWPLVEAIINLLRSCETGKNHTVYRMADGFECMLAQLSKTEDSRNNGQRNEVAGPSVRGSSSRLEALQTLEMSPEALHSSSDTVLLNTGPPEYGGAWDLPGEHPYDLLGLSGQGFLGDMDFLTFD